MSRQTTLTRFDLIVLARAKRPSTLRAKWGPNAGIAVTVVLADSRRTVTGRTIELTAADQIHVGRRRT